MSQSERRHERLAVRLSLIISRLVAGETLAIQTLAAEFGVSVRTLRRDFRERLAYLDTEFRNGQCRLLSGSRQGADGADLRPSVRCGGAFSGDRQPAGQLTIECQRISLPYLAQHQRQNTGTE